MTGRLKLREERQGQGYESTERRETRSMTRRLELRAVRLELRAVRLEQ